MSARLQVNAPDRPIRPLSVLSRRLSMMLRSPPTCCEIDFSDVANSLGAAIILPKTDVTTVDIWLCRSWHIQYLARSIPGTLNESNSADTGSLRDNARPAASWCGIFLDVPMCAGFQLLWPRFC